jgi:hypothetical protein
MNLALFSLVLFLLLWAWFWYIQHGHVFEFDPGDHKFMFLALLNVYRGTYWIIFILTLTAAFVTLNRHIGSGVSSLFLGSALYALLFNLLLPVFYESYLAYKYTINGPLRSNYTAAKYGLILALGYSSALLAIAGTGIAFITMAGN